MKECYVRESVLTSANGQRYFDALRLSASTRGKTFSPGFGVWTNEMDGRRPGNGSGLRLEIETTGCSERTVRDAAKDGRVRSCEIAGLAGRL